MFIVNPYILISVSNPSNYLLDTYSAAAAYSLRQLRTGVTNVVRVRRSSDNREENFTATEVTDGTLTGFCGGGDGFVVTWYDQSGNANDITQSTAGNQPRVVASGVVQVFGNGYGVNFNVTTGLQYLSLGSGLSALSSEPFTWFAPTKGTSTGVYSVIFNTGSGATANSRFQTYLAVKSSGTVSTLTKNTSGTSYSIAPTALTASQEYLRSQVVDSSKGIEDFVNGSSIGTVTFTGSYVNDVFQVGANTNLSQECTGVIPELIIFGTDESANRTDIESDIDTHYWGADLLLDTYSGAAAAYSLRKLSKYTTNVVRVRRDLDNAEQDFTADEITDGTLIGWVGTSTRKGYVVTWYDQSGNGNDITQSVTSAQARIANNGGVQLLAGTSRPGASFGIVNLQYYTRTALPELDHGNNFSIFSVHRNLTDADAIVSTRNTTTLDRFVHMGGGSTNGPVGHVHNGSTPYFANTTQLSNQTTQATTIVDGTAKTINSWQNGGNNGNVTWTGTYTNAILQMGMDRDNDWEAGVLGEVIIFGTDQSANRTAIESDMNAYYSLY